MPIPCCENARIVWLYVLGQLCDSFMVAWRYDTVVLHDENEVVERRNGNCCKTVSPAGVASRVMDTICRTICRAGPIQAEVFFVHCESDDESNTNYGEKGTQKASIGRPVTDESAQSRGNPKPKFHNPKPPKLPSLAPES